MHGHAQGLQLDHLLPLREGGDPPLPKLEGDLHQVIGRTPETLPEMNSRRLLLLMSGVLDLLEAFLTRLPDLQYPLKTPKDEDYW